MGQLGVDAIGNRDYAVLMGLTLFTAVLVLIGNLVPISCIPCKSTYPVLRR